jgi:hypothetical protein
MSSPSQIPPGSGPVPGENGRGEWLLLVHQLPAEPSNLRVKTWRRLQGLGAVLLRHAVYVLPNSAQAREDFAWVRAEIAAMRGQATILTADAVDDADRQAIVEAFRAARTADFAAIRRDIDRLGRQLRGRAASRDGRFARRVTTAAQGLRQIEAVDFFAAPGGDEARQALTALEDRMTGKKGRTAQADELPGLKRGAYARRVWVTRRRPGVDRMSSAWLIRRFIDPDATFAFAARDNVPPSDQVAFDMFSGEFTHHADLCTFEVLMRRFRLERPALKRIAEIVHDLDLKDHRYQPPEAPTIGALVEGVRQAAGEDREALERGMSIFEALYQSFSTGTPAKS